MLLLLLAVVAGRPRRTMLCVVQHRRSNTL